MKKLLALSTLLLTVFFSAKANAFVIAAAPPISQIVGKSDVVAIASLTSIDADDKYANTPSSNSIINKPGIYTFNIESFIKGESEKNIKVEIGNLFEFHYRSRMIIEIGGVYVVMLKKSDNSLSPTFDFMPFFPISKKQDYKIPSSNISAQNTVLTLLAESLTDENLRQASSFLLRDELEPRLVPSLAPYLNDKNNIVVDNVLSFMCYNQQIVIIGRIVKLAESNKFSHSKQFSALALGQFKSPSAVPSLNAALFSSSALIRSFSASALSAIVDKTSIPYLFLLLHDPVDSGFSGQYAYATFHTILPEMKQPEGNGYFYSHKSEEVKLLLVWWQDELSGKHPANPDEKPAVELRQAQRFEASDLPQLNQGLFMKSEITRRAAIRGLQQFADQSSVPYLLIALYDPQPEIAFDAYTILHRLVPDLGAASAGQWRTERAAQTKAAFDWWQQHLLDADKK